MERGFDYRRSRIRRFLFRRLFYLQLPKIVAGNLWARSSSESRLFVSLMGGIGDLVNFLPTTEKLSERYAVEIATGTYPYLALVRNNPYLKKIYAPFVYKPIRRAHRRLIEQLLAPFYQHVILLDNYDSRWWDRGKHISAIYAEKCDCPPPEKGAIYLKDENKRSAQSYLRTIGVTNFIYAQQVIRYRRLFRSWPLVHHHELFRMLRDRSSLPILVDTTGSDETDLPSFCMRLERLDILTAAAVIERARLYVGVDSGLTHIAGALGVPTVSIHLGYPAESCQALGENVTVIRQPCPFDDPARTSPEEVLATIKNIL